MFAPQSPWQPQGYPQQYPAAASWPAHPAPWVNQPPYRPAGQQPIFQVRLTKHTGLILAFYNQRYTVTGTFAQCEQAIRQAQQHNLLAGWWSIASLVVWNWIALAANLGARKTLRRNAAQAFSARVAG